MIAAVLFKIPGVLGESLLNNDHTKLLKKNKFRQVILKKRAGNKPAKNVCS